MIKILKNKTLKFQIFFISAIMTCVLIILLGKLIIESFKTFELSEDYILKNEITNHLNSAAIWQALERGYGATIIGSGEGDSSPLFTNFLEAAKKGDAEVLQADKKMKILLSTRKNEVFEDKRYSWIMGYGDLVDARPRVAYRNISKYEWLEIATHNINNEFDLRNITFSPQKKDEEILYLNNVLLPNITELCEYAGLERALIGNTIASGKPLSNETINSIKHYRSIVELALGQVMLLKELPFTSSKMKQAIETFDKEFLQEYQLLREEVFSSSKRQEEDVNNVKEQIAKRSTVLQNYLSGISSEMLNMSIHINVIALAKALMAEEDIHLSERLSAVENMFNAFSQIKKDYMQIRFLDNLGYERVRVDYDGDNSKIIPGSQLQDKSDRYYFKEALKLLPGGIYTSMLDLNMEHGEIEISHKPVIRFATPVFVDGKQGGVIVFNILANNLLFLHKETDNEGKEDYILANQNGFYLHHPVEMKKWGMSELLNKSHHNIRQDYPDAAEEILSGRAGSVRLVSGIVIVYEPFFLNIGHDADNFWVIIKQIKGVEYPVSASAWFDAATKAINTGLAISNIAGAQARTNTLKMKSSARKSILFSFIILVFTIIVFISSIWWTRKQVLKPIYKLTETTQEIIQGNLSRKAEVKSEDEIGTLADNFNKMAEDLINIKRDWESTFDSIGDIITLHDKDNRLIRFNTALTSSLNIKPKYNAAEKYYDFTHNEDDVFFEASMKEVSQTKRPVMIEVEMPDIGSIFSISSFPRFNNNDEFVGTVQIMRDITDLKHAESALKTHARQQAVVANLGHKALLGGDLKVLMNDMTKNIAEILDNEYCKVLELLPDGKNMLLRAGVGWKEGLVGHATVHTGLDSQAGYTLQLNHPVIVKDLKTETRFSGPPLLREHNIVSGMSVVIPGQNGPWGVLAAHATCHRIFSKDDVNFLQSLANLLASSISRLRSENALRESKEKYSKLIENAQDAIVCIDEDEIINVWNLVAEKIFGYSKSEIIGKPVTTIIPEKHRKEHQKGMERFLKTGVPRIIGKTVEVSGITKEGIEIPIELSLSFHKDKVGRYSFTSIIRDITERKHMEQQMLQAQKLESIGQLASGIAHEINTPTQYITDNTRFLQDAFSDISKLLEKYSHLVEANNAGSSTTELINEVSLMARDVDVGYLIEEIPRAIKQSQEGLCRVTEIVKAMKTFSHPGNVEKTPVDIKELIESTIAVARNEWKFVADMETDFDPDLPQVPCFPGDLNQVVLNLVINAAHAVEEVANNGAGGKGVIKVSTRCDGEWAEIRISDTGKGISKENRSRIFDPFFTTKETGKGTGQGLSVTHSIVVGRHNGTITFDTEIGKGTTFIVRLPLNPN
jgi:PAS domain S-box-containing protein